MIHRSMAYVHHTEYFKICFTYLKFCSDKPGPFPLIYGNTVGGRPAKMEMNHLLAGLFCCVLVPGTLASISLAFIICGCFGFCTSHASTSFVCLDSLAFGFSL